MKKIFLALLVLFIGLAEASTLNSGAIICNNAESIRELNRLDEQRKLAEFINYYASMEQRGVCSTAVARMNPDNLGRKDLNGGVTQIGSIFVLTSEIR